MPILKCPLPLRKSYNRLLNITTIFESYRSSLHNDRDMKSVTQTSSAIPLRLVEDLLIVQYKFATVALLLLVQTSSAALQDHPLLGVQAHVPPVEVGTQGMRAVGAASALVGVDCRVADRAEVVLGHEVAGFELQGAVLDLPEAVDQHAEDVDGNALADRLRGEGKQPSIWAKLALDCPSLGQRPLLERTGLAESLSGGSIAELMETYMAIRAIREGIILFMMRTQTPSTCSFQDSLGVLPGLLALLALHVLFELLLISDRASLLRVDASVLLEGIQVGKVVELIDI